MTLSYRLLILHGLVSTLGLVYTHPNPLLAQAPGRKCQTPALERFQRHKIALGETLESIAQRYNLTPATIITLNPNLGNRRVPPGSEIQIPPYDGIVVEIPPSQNWRQVALQYQIRPDVLFELNGCQNNPRVVFVPSTDQSSNPRITRSSYPIAQKEESSTKRDSSTSSSNQLAGYPLTRRAQVAVPYGWQVNPANNEVFFHSGLDLLAQKGSPVLAISPGKVVFSGPQGTYGNIVIINHGGGLQSRYAHLEGTRVSRGQTVQKGDLLGTVGTTGQPTISQPHLHFEVRSSSSLGWKAQDPTAYLR